MTLAEISERLRNQEALDVLSNKQQEQLREVLEHEGFAVFIGLLFGARQTQLLALSMAPAGNLTEVQRIGVLQGTIRGIELSIETALEQVQANGADQ